MAYTRSPDMRQLNPCTNETFFDVISAGVFSRNLRILIFGGITPKIFLKSRGYTVDSELTGCYMQRCETLVFEKCEQASADKHH
jgi:hypothetical protein